MPSSLAKRTFIYNTLSIYTLQCIISFITPYQSLFVIESLLLIDTSSQDLAFEGANDNAVLSRLRRIFFDVEYVQMITLNTMFLCKNHDLALRRVTNKHRQHVRGLRGRCRGPTQPHPSTSMPTPLTDLASVLIKIWQYRKGKHHRRVFEEMILHDHFVVCVEDRRAAPQALLERLTSCFPCSLKHVWCDV